ncbi:MAG: hypothetical protein WAL84_10485 [Candidatus Dormiibacterota bacterium]
MGDRYKEIGLRAYIRVADYWEDGYTLDVTYRSQPAPILSWHCETNREAQDKIEDALFEAWEILFGKRPDQD